jgi:hypothetical protein
MRLLEELAEAKVAPELRPMNQLIVRRLPLRVRARRPAAPAAIQSRCCARQRGERWGRHGACDAPCTRDDPIKVSSSNWTSITAPPPLA